MGPEVKALFDSISDAIVLVTADGRPRFANVSARETWGLVADGRFVNESLENLIGWALRGFVSLPVNATFSIPLTCGLSRLSARIQRSPVDGEYTVVIRPEADAARWDALGGLLLDVVQREVSAPAQVCALSLRLASQYLAEIPERSAALDRLQRRCEANAARLSGVVRGLSERVEAIRLAELGTVESVPIGPLVERAIDEASATLVARGQHLEFDLEPIELSVVSGSPWWYEWMIADLLVGAAEQAAARSTLTLTTERTQDAVVVCIGWMTKAAGWRARFPGLLRRLTGREEEPVDETLAEDQIDLRLGSRFAGRLLSHYGGSLSQSADGAEGGWYRLRLPTRAAVGAESLDSMSSRVRQAGAAATNLIERLMSDVRAIRATPFQQPPGGLADRPGASS